MMYNVTAKSICAKVDEYARLKIQIDELTNQAETIAAILKGMMIEKGIQEMSAGSHIVILKPFISKRIDTIALKKLLGEDTLEPVMKTVSTLRFSVK